MSNVNVRKCFGDKTKPNKKMLLFFQSAKATPKEETVLCNIRHFHLVFVWQAAGLGLSGFLLGFFFYLELWLILSIFLT